MAAQNRTKMGTAFTVSIEAAEGITTGISAADRARTIQAAVAPNARAEDLVQPGHIFPLQAVDGGVLMRAGHTEAGCDLAAMAGGTPAAVICEVMKDDGTMARLPDLQRFAAEHHLKIGTIADLIEYRSRTETLIEFVAERFIRTAQGTFRGRAYRDKPNGGLHLALTLGYWQPDAIVPVRVHEPLSVLDVLDKDYDGHSWSIDAALAHIQQAGRGVAVLLNCSESADQLLKRFESEYPSPGAARLGPKRQFDLRSYGIGAQILRDCAVRRLLVLGTPLRLPGMAGGFGLEVTGYLPNSSALNPIEVEDEGC
jgi:3,4-dihydroxy 2-butanone 4-phosphate synthase/GTP cyclohydrolase II